MVAYQESTALQHLTLLGDQELGYQGWLQFVVLVFQVLFKKSGRFIGHMIHDYYNLL